MNAKPNTRLNIDQDYRIFFIFMTLVLVGMYIFSLVQNPALRQFWLAALFTVLMLVHLLLHWMVVRIIEKPARQVWYILGQGLLAFAITHLSNNTGMIFGLYMALIGETIGFLGLNRWSALSNFYFLGLLVLNFIIFTNSGLSAALFWGFTVIPIALFVGLYVTLYMRQADAREKAQALADELEAVNRQLSDYAARVEDLSIANERQRMARELHDTLSQGLAGLILQLEAADAQLDHQRPEKARAIIAEAMQRARAALADARRVISNLRENDLGELGEALRLEATRFEAATGLPCIFHADQAPPLPEAVKETLLRAVSEALTNIARHARASQASVSLTVKDQTLTVAIQDNGIGFDPEGIPSGHYGILGIRERVRLAGGTFTLDTALQKGTILTIELPLPQLTSKIESP
jgi:NarL family two-component system sensor histidine kinase YdfH